MTNLKKLKFITIILASLLTVAGMIGCSSSEQPINIEKKEPVRAQKASPSDEGEADAYDNLLNPPEGGWIKRAYFSPHLDENGRSLKINVETTVPKDYDQSFTYIFWKNSEKIEEKQEDDNLIPYSSFKAGDFIYVDVLLYRGDKLLEKKRSEALFVKNTDPIIQEVRLPEIDGPGTYIIPVKAKDPEGDKISFSLEGEPLFEGLKIDPATGTVTCTLGDNAPPETMEFIITAKDGKGGIAKKVVTIKFQINNQLESG